MHPNIFISRIVFLLKNEIAEIVNRFKVDGIPHLAFMDSKTEVKTALVGAIPKTILSDEVEALAKV